MVVKHLTNANGIVGKICTKCGLWCPLDEFHKDNHKTDGLYHWCENCVFEYNHSDKGKSTYYKYRRSKKGKQMVAKSDAKKCNIHKLVIHRLKYNGCAICGYDKCPSALDFHHTNPSDKKFVVSVRNMGLTDERLVDEINKCILLCCRCHREIENIGDIICE